MALKFKFNSKSEIPTELAAHYVERDGAWVLEADGVADKTKLDEFRNSNLALLKSLIWRRYDFGPPQQGRGGVRNDNLTASHLD